jgi:squalene-associated FAD-dependent desaturase
MGQGKAGQIGIIGGGWAGCAAAALLAERGHAVTLLEAAPMLGGRARKLATLDSPWPLDNGQHIAIGAYADTLALLQKLGVAESDAFLRMPFNLRRVDGSGLRFPDLPAPVNALAGILGAKGWSWGDRLALLRWAAAWQIKGFRCRADLTLAQITQHLPPVVQQQFITPLCLSALNTAVPEASAQVFLRVLRDAMFLFPKGADFLLPKQDLGALLPQAAQRYVATQGGQMLCGQRVLGLQKTAAGWQVATAEKTYAFSQVLLATPAWAALDLLADCGLQSPQISRWLAAVRQFEHRPIATVYASSPRPLPAPMLALADSADGWAAPAQFVFDRSQLLPASAQADRHLLAFVISLCGLDKNALQAAVLQQAKTQLGLDLQAVQTVVEKRATIAATPAAFAAKANLPSHLGDGLHAIGDYLHPVYPSTLEGAVQTALSAIAHGQF